jgi:MFS family permease
MDSHTAAISSTAIPSAAPRQKKPGLLINRQYALLWSGHAISILGDFAFSTTLAVWVFLLAGGASWAPLAVTGVYVATAVPQIVVGPIAGVFVDRWDKRRTMLAMDVVRAVVVAALILATGALSLPGGLTLPYFGEVLPAGLVSAGQLPLEWRLGAIYGVVIIVMSCEQFSRPSMTALLGDLVPDEYRGQAMGLSQTTMSMAMLFGSLLAPGLVVTFGPQWTLAFDAFSFVVSFLSILAIRAPASARSVRSGERGHFGREFATGVRFFARSRVSMTVLIASVIMMASASGLNVLDIFFVTDNLHAGVEFYGVISAVFAVGMMLGSVVAAVYARRLGYARTLWLSMFGIDLVIIAYSRMTSVIPAMALMALMGLTNAGLSVAIGPLMLAVTPRALIGRSMALLGPAMAIAGLAGTAVSGYLASDVLLGFSASAYGMRFGPIDTIYAVSGLLALIGAAYCALNLRARAVERERVAKETADAPQVTAAATAEGAKPAEEREALAV